MYRIGFACKYKHENKENLSDKEVLAIESSFNVKTTTIRYISSLSEKEQLTKINTIVEHNLLSLRKLLDYVSTLPKELNMLRISSDLLPLYTHEDYKKYYKNKSLKKLIEKELYEIGKLAKKNNTRLSMHPDQFCVLGSEKEHVVNNSIKEFEYHADLIRMMDYGNKFQDFKCNIHISGALGVAGMINSMKKLSKEALNTITIENDEKKFGLNECLELSEYCPIVLDIHHYWCREGERISVDDERIDLILQSWRDVRPTMHYSQSKEYFKELGQSENEHFDFNYLKEKNGNKKDLYAHSDMLWNNKTNEYAKDFLNKFDIMVEAKNKNLASIDFFKKVSNLN